MTMDDPPFEPDRALFERWRAAAGSDAPGPVDALTLAAYAEGRLDEAAAERVEAALAADPTLLDTLLALRAPAEAVLPSPELIRSAQALVPAEAVVVPFIRPAAAPRPLKAWLAWGALAASLLLVSTAGFGVGMLTSSAVSAPAATASDESPADLLDLSSFAGDDIG